MKINKFHNPCGYELQDQVKYYFEYLHLIETVKKGKMPYIEKFNLYGYPSDFPRVEEIITDILGVPNFVESSADGANKEIFYYNKDFVSHISLNFVGGSSGISLTSRKKGLKNEVYDQLNLLFERKEKGSVFMIMAAHGGYTLSPIGIGMKGFQRENYSENVVKGYDFIRGEMEKELPSGRLALLHGEPGTGKTYFIRGLLGDCDDCIFLLMSPSMVQELDGPSFVAVLSGKKKQERDKSIVIILEDADSCLVPRGSDNMSSISSLLNFTDGIFGSILDLKIVATTNAEKINVERALLRPGRLMKQLSIGKLNKEEASKAYEAVTGTKKKIERSMILAEVYALARNDGEEIKESNVIEKHKVGFLSLADDEDDFGL
jgi:hypothetical protein